MKIYRALTYGCGYWIFNTDNTFRSVGYKQTELLRVVIEKCFYSGIDKDKIRQTIALVLEGYVDRETLPTGLMLTLVDCLKSPETKEIAILECDEYLKSGIGKIFSKDKLFRINLSEYRRNDIIENIHELCFHLRAALFEYDKAVSEYKKNIKVSKEKNKEIGLYCMLRWLEMYDQVDLWIREYEAAVARRISPRKELEEKYEILKECKSFEVMWKKLKNSAAIVIKTWELNISS